MYHSRVSTLKWYTLSDGLKLAKTNEKAEPNNNLEIRLGMTLATAHTCKQHDQIME